MGSAGPSTAQNGTVAASPRDAALDLLEEYWTDADGKVDFPVDPVVIAQRIGAEVIRADLEPNVSGLLVKEPNDESAKIYLNGEDHESRQRFTCAHELGHLARRRSDKNLRIGFVDSRDTLSSTGTDPEEIWANQFAAELLMPAVAVRTLWSQGQSQPKIARVFGVSQRAVEVRLASLKLS
jgi:Zn-dependent peptidase ImmA (M78 family)